MGTVHAHAHGVLQRQLPEQSMGTGSPGTSSVAAVALRLGSRGLGVVFLLLGDAHEPHGGVPVCT